MQKEGVNSVEFVKWFFQLNKNSVDVVGGKGANLAEIYNLKIPVPPGFVVTAQAYDYFIEKSELKPKIWDLLKEINYDDVSQLDSITSKIRELISGAKMPKEMEDEIIESYETLSSEHVGFSEVNADSVLKKSEKEIHVAVRSSATAEDLADASFAGQQESFVNVFGKKELIQKTKECFASLFTSRAVYYRKKKGFDDMKVKLAVVVQKMVDSSRSGVVFSKDPSGKNENVLIEAVFGLGEGIVSGRITPDSYIYSREKGIVESKVSNKKIALVKDEEKKVVEVELSEEKSNAQVLKNHEIEKIARIALKLEGHYGIPQDIEFAVEGEKLFIVQTRAITTLSSKNIVERGKVEVYGESILSGLGASPGIASGKVKVINSMSDLSKITSGDILVTKMTNPDMVVSMQKASAIITDEGGVTSHAAIVSREMGIPCVVGTQTATIKLKEGEIVTVDGFSGRIYKGKTSERMVKEVEPVEAVTKIKIKVIIDLPSFAERAAKTGIKEVGLLRIEGIIAESGKHPNYFLEKNKIPEYENIIFQGVRKIANHFEKLWVRTSDIRSDEFYNLEGSPKIKEANPMLGMHGIRFGMKYPKILRAELSALKKVSATSSADDAKKEIGIMMPQVISVDEVKLVKKILQEIGFKNAKVGVMIETPAAVQIIKEICEEKIHFVSFGTNDLTQYTLAIDRGNEKVQHLYNEMHPAILSQLSYVIRVAKRNNVETSICGQAGSQKEMVKFLVENGIDSISVNPDAAKEVSEYVAEIEGNNH
ncbi:phosphoenolpyruvate synthase [Candidatus Pacearchaeota archaeon]|nr:phosphoenolpyruvate synthase [Candidatus Pacearchaeota archaeon]